MAEYVTKKDLDAFRNDFRKDINEDFKRHTGILIEEFKKNLDFVVDQQQDMRREIRELDQKLDSLHDEVVAHRGNTEVHTKQERKPRRMK